MPRKTITRLRKKCGRLAGHSRQQAERVAKAALETIRDQLPEGQETVDLLQFQLFLGQRLEATRDQLTALDNEHAHELQVDRNLREERTSAAKEVRERLFQLRDSLDGLFGTGGSAKIFEDVPRIPDDPMELHQLTGHIRANLSNPSFEMPRPLQQSFKLDREAAVAELAEPYQRLEDSLRQLEDTESDSKNSQSEKDSSVSDSQIFADRVARFYEAFYALVGLERLARRVRRSSHRRNDGEVEEPDVQPEDSDESEEAAAATDDEEAAQPAAD